MTLFETPDQAEAAFYEAFERCDATAMGRVWTDSEQACCIHPGGPLLQGSDAVLQSWGEIFSQARPPEVGFRVVQRQLTAELAIHIVEEAIRPAGGRDTPTRVIALNVYRQGPDGWHMLTHHASLPMMGQSQARGPVH